ncbi:uncharacterized protein LOC136036666 [Artemia franciscana]|uniref:uncharacterized protein LOC136036666 n=1 Tax=Artemia franciscana TaxID=6661 RepID=UPI0032DBD112
MLDRLGVGLLVASRVISDGLLQIYHRCATTHLSIFRSVVPDSFLCGSDTSILKKGKDLNSCNSCRPITVACILSKLLQYVLLPHIDDFVNYEANQFGFRSGLSCQHAHHVLAQLIKEASRSNYSLHFCTFDIPKAFDSVCHAQAWYAHSQFGVNASVILVLVFKFLFKIKLKEW